MNLLVISPEHMHPHELELVRGMFAAGLRWYHLRKPTWSRSQMHDWLTRLSRSERARVVVHQNHDLVDELGVGGCHWRDNGALRLPSHSPGHVNSRACHDLRQLEGELSLAGQPGASGVHFHHVLVSPLYPSFSKPGYGTETRLDRARLREILSTRAPARPGQHRTEVIGLGGIDVSRLEECHSLGLDGVAVLGAIWQAPDPLVAFETLHRACRFGSTAAELSHARKHLPHHRVMCITQDGLPLSHVEQARRLCTAGAQWIQLRMKDADPNVWLETAREFVAVCRQYGAISIINDSVEIALAARADGVHLGKLDQEWTAARGVLGPDKILGGTVNNAEDADRAVASGCLDYVGVGPWRFTANKRNLAPLLGAAGVSAVVKRLQGLPAWVIGGVVPGDLSAVQATGAAGVAVSSALYKGNAVEENFRTFRWPVASAGNSPSSTTPAARAGRHGPVAAN